MYKIDELNEFLIYLKLVKEINIYIIVSKINFIGNIFETIIKRIRQVPFSE